MRTTWITAPPSTVSELTVFAKCPAMWHYLYKLRRRARKAPSPALSLGATVHHVLESNMRALMEGRRVGTSQEGWEEVLLGTFKHDTGQDPGPEEKRTLVALSHYLSGWFRKEDWPWDSIKAVETTFTRRAEPQEFDTRPKVGKRFYMRGKADAIITRADRPWLFEWKTLSPSTPIGVYLRGFKRSLQSTLYPWLAELEHGPIAGWILVIIRKLPLHDKKGNTRTDEQAIEVIELPIGPETMRRGIEVAKRTFWSREVHIQWKAPPEQRGAATGLCMGRYGNSLCDFVDVCDDAASILDDLLFEDYNPQERYEEKEGE